LPSTEAELEELVPIHSLSPVQNCPHCEARCWPEECTKKKVFTDCCLNGQLHGAIPPLIPHPDELESLLAGTTDESRLFLNNTRTYNNRFAFASIVGKFRDQKDLAGTGVSPVVLQGSLCHKISPLSPLASGSAAFGQVYFLDDETALKHRLSLNQLAGSSNRARQDESNMRVITTIMEQINPFVKWFKCAKEILQRNQLEGCRTML
jgi:hypothetical protein